MFSAFAPRLHLVTGRGKASPCRDGLKTYVKTQLTLTLEKGDVDIMGNLAAHNWQKAEEASQTKGAPGYSSCHP
jgi:hypothetical protein